VTAGSLEAVASTLGRVLQGSGRDVQLRDRASGQIRSVSVDLATAPDGLLPVFLASGDAVWREATGAGIGLRIEPDERALLGYRAAKVGNVPFSTVMLATIEAVEQAARPGVLLVNDLNAVWRAATPLPVPGNAPGPVL
jgi:hypothetical protein